MITFEYNGKIYKPSNLENKLKKLGITINDVKIIDDTKSNTEKEREERSQQNNIDNYTVDVYWDSKSKGWYIVDRHVQHSQSWKEHLFQGIESGQYKLIQHDVNQNNLHEFFEKNYKRVISNSFK